MLCEKLPFCCFHALKYQIVWSVLIRSLNVALKSCEAKDAKHSAVTGCVERKYFSKSDDVTRHAITLDVFNDSDAKLECNLSPEISD